MDAVMLFVALLAVVAGIAIYDPADDDLGLTLLRGLEDDGHGKRK